jgi:hypothetical protein
MEKLEKEYLQKSITYDKYRKLMHELVVQGKTTGPDQSPLQIKFTKLNEHRMHRLEKTVHLNDSLIKTVQSLNKKWIWVILTEAWCGDVAQNAPTIQKIADLNELITVHYLLRDENIPLMDRYLTDGGRAIPKLICYDVETLMPIGHWGPRPAPAQQLMHTLKSQKPPLSFDEIHEPLHKWYAEDRTQTLQKEMEDLIKDWIKII